MTPSFQVKNAVLMMALAAAYPLQAHAAAGITQFTAGDVTLRRGSGTAPLIKGRDLESGDAIVTGPGGRAQIRFSDGGLVALQPDSQFNITNYADKNDPKQDSFLVDLLRGGMRAVTGLIGKRNRENFRVTTQTATVGIRGSAFTLGYNPDGTLSVATELDEIEVCTSAGCVGLTAGEAARVDNNQTLPVRTNARATLDTPAPRQEAKVAGNQVDAKGTPQILGTVTRASPQPQDPAPVVPPKDTDPPVVINPPPVVNPPLPTDPQPVNTLLTGLAFSGAGTTSGDGSSIAIQSLYTNGTMVLDPNGVPVQYLAQNNDTITPSGNTEPLLTQSSGTYAGGDLMAVGSFANSVWTTTSGGTSLPGGGSLVSQAAFVTGTPTPATSISALEGIQGRYSFDYGTPIFSTSAGRVGEFERDSNLVVSFLGAGNYVTANLNVRLFDPNGGGGGGGGGGATDGASTFAVAGYDTYYYLKGTGVFDRATNGVSAGFAGQLACNTGGYGCSGGAFRGFFGGPSALTAGLSFYANTYSDGIINGAGVFTRDDNLPYSAAFVEGAVTGTNQQLFGAIGSYNDFGRNADGNERFQFNGNQLTSWSRSGDGGDAIARTSVATDAFGSAGDQYNGDFIGWGNWVGASAYTGYSQSLDSVHYIVGTPTAHRPLSGTAFFSQTGGTSPTGTLYTSGGSSIITTGTLNANGSLNVDFGSNSVLVNVSGTVGAQPFSIANAPATIAVPSYNSSGATFTSGSNDAVFINGLFTGATANRAGLVYGLGSSSSGVGRIAGAVAFEKAVPQ